MFYLICYDIGHDRRRDKVSRLLSGYGLRVQKSVFVCVLNESQREMVCRKLHCFLKSEEDQVRFYPMSGHTRPKVMILGIQPNHQVDDEVFIV